MPQCKHMVFVVSNEIQFSIDLVASDGNRHRRMYGNHLICDAFAFSAIGGKSSSKYTKTLYYVTYFNFPLGGCVRVCVCVSRLTISRSEFAILNTVIIF